MTDQPNTERRLPTADEVRGILKPDPPEQERCPTCGSRRRHVLNVECASDIRDPDDWHANRSPSPQEGDEGVAVLGYQGDTVRVGDALIRVLEAPKGGAEFVPRSAYDRAIEERDEWKAMAKALRMALDHARSERDAAIERAEAAERGKRGWRRRASDMETRAKWAETQLTTLQERVRELENALRPFALAWEQRDENHGPEGPPSAVQVAGQTHGDDPWKVAAQALEEEGS